MHRSRAAKLSSRATVMRRLHRGTWWRPTSATVALRSVDQDADFTVLVGAAHAWPHGGVAGSSLPHLLGLGPASNAVELSIPRPRRLTVPEGYVVHRRSSVVLGALVLASGRQLTVDVGASSINAAAKDLSTEDVAWLLIRSLGLLPPTRNPREVCDAIGSYALRLNSSRSEEWFALSQAVADGCESAGEVYVWHLLHTLGVRFRTQSHHRVAHPDRGYLGQSHIRTDFLLEADVIVEVDSALHEHLKDVRRDLWNLAEGRRTIRIVGSDVIADPEGACHRLAEGLRRFGVPLRPTALPSWLTAG